MRNTPDPAILLAQNPRSEPQTQGNFPKPAVQNPVPNPTKRRRPVGGALDTESHNSPQVLETGNLQKTYNTRS